MSSTRYEMSGTDLCYHPMRWSSRDQYWRRNVCFSLRNVQYGHTLSSSVLAPKCPALATKCPVLIWASSYAVMVSTGICYGARHQVAKGCPEWMQKLILKIS
eukprot:1350635-Rhodomonas_salina.1